MKYKNQQSPGDNRELVSEECMVSIKMITYNHEPYIAQAIEGVVMQKTTFKIELIIGEDCSTDATRKICEEYAEKYPEIIRLLPSVKNLGMINNGTRTLNAGTGKYIAICDGDDYWTDPYKLQKQIEFLEANPDYAICFHRVYELETDKDPVLSNLNVSEQEETYTIEDLAKGNFIHTPSVVFRNKLFGQFPVWFHDSPVGDYPLYMLNAKHGKIKYFPQAMAVYRRHTGGMWSVQSEEQILEKWLKVLDYLLTEDFNDIVLKNLLQQKRKHSTEYLKILFETDQDLFLNKMKELTQNDEELTKVWILIHYPQMIKELKNTRIYRLAKKLSAIKSIWNKITS